MFMSSVRKIAFGAKDTGFDANPLFTCHKMRMINCGEKNI